MVPSDTCSRKRDAVALGRRGSMSDQMTGEGSLQVY